MQSLNNTPFLFSELICSDSFQFNNSVKTQQIILQQYWTSFYALGLTRNMQFKFRRNDFNMNSLQKKEKEKILSKPRSLYKMLPSVPQSCYLLSNNVL